MSLNAGADDFLAKPIQSQDLFHLLTSHLQLTWQYEEMVVSPAISVEFIVPDSVDLKLLLELVQEGRLKKLVEMAEQIEQKDQRYQPFIQQILQFVKLYQSEMIEELIQQYLTINKH
jgi:DNA-binding response OmpR family regulator